MAATTTRAEPGRPPAPGLPPLRLAALVLAVLAAHAVLLAGVDLGERPAMADVRTPRSMLTRTLAVPSPAPAPAAPLVAVAAPVPVPVATPRAARKITQNVPETPTVIAQAATETIAIEIPPSGFGVGPGPSPVEMPAASATTAPPVEPVASALAAATPAAAPAAPVAVPASVQLDYDVEVRAKGVANRARATLRWQHDGAAYDAQLTIDNFALRLVGRTRVQTSRGRIGEHGLMPQRFSDKARGEQAAHFSDDSRQVTFSANTPPAALEAGAQDRLSVVLQLSALFAGDPARYPTGSRIALQTVGAREAEPWVFTVEASETLDLPAGRIEAVRLLRTPRREFDATAEFWLAPTQRYLPVRLRLTQANGDVLDQQLLAMPP